MYFWVFCVACAIGTVMHFLYRPLGQPALLAFLLPVSESVWEHAKMAVWPLCGAMLYLGCQYGIAPGAILCACLLCAVHAMASMFGFFYVYFYGLGVRRPVLWLDICCYYLVMGGSFVMGLFALTLHPPLVVGGLCAAGLLVLAVVFGRFSFAPPKLPLFTPIS